MRIAFVNQPWNTIDPPVESPDSIAILIYEMARRIAHSYEVTIYSKKGRSQATVERHEGVTYKRISTKFDLLLKPLNLLDRFRLTNLKRPFCSWIFYYFWYARKIARDLRKNNYDIVHVFTFSNFIPIIRYYNPEIKIVLHMEDHSLTQRDRNMINRRLEKADLVIGCSHFITDNIRKRYPNISDRCHTLYNGVDVDHFNSNLKPKSANVSKPKRLLFVGRLSPEKGLHVLLKALQKISIRHSEVELEVAGPFLIVNKFFIDPLDEDTYLANLDNYYRKSKNYHESLKNTLSPKLQGSVSFLGSVPHSELINNYHKADIFVIPSLWNEPFGIPLVEAMAAGLPVVATKGGAFPEIVEEGKTGFLVERGDVDSLAENILKLILNEELCRSMGQTARQRVVQLFSWDPIIKRLLSLYNHISHRGTF